MKIVFQIFLFPFPWVIRKYLLKVFFNFNLGNNSYIGYSLILAKTVNLSEGARIGHFTICKGISFLEIKENGKIGTLNYITGYPNHLTGSFSHVKDRNCILQIGKYSSITSRHFIDCTGGVYLGDYTTFAGIKSQILTHSIDLKKCIQDAAAVRIGNYCFVGTSCVILKGSSLPNYSILGASSLLNKKFSEEYCIYGGVPSAKLKNIKGEDYLYFKREIGYVK